jgi:hypothetical protein
LFCSNNIIRLIKRVGEKRNTYGIFLGELEGKTPLGRPGHRWEAIKVDLKEIGLGGVDWIDLAQDRDKWRTLVWTAINFWVP